MDYRLKYIKILIEDRTEQNMGRGPSTKVKISLGPGLDVSRSSSNLSILDQIAPSEQHRQAIEDRYRIIHKNLNPEDLETKMQNLRKKISTEILTSRLKLVTPKGWTVEVPENPGKDETKKSELMLSTHVGQSGGRVITHVRPDIAWTRSDGKRITAEIKVVEPVKTKPQKTGSCGTFDVSCHGTRARHYLTDVILQLNPFKRRLPKGGIEEKEYSEILKDTLRKNDLTIIKNGDNLHVVWPHGDTEDDLQSESYKHVHDFLQTTGLKVTHLFDHTKRSGWAFVGGNN